MTKKTLIIVFETSRKANQSHQDLEQRKYQLFLVAKHVWTLKGEADLELIRNEIILRLFHEINIQPALKFLGFRLGLFK